MSNNNTSSVDNIFKILNDLGTDARRTIAQEIRNSKLFIL